jgi:dihydrofolate synthase / folylpolyglutamate synthase
MESNVSRFANEAEAITYVFKSLRRLTGVERGPDEQSRDTMPTQRLVQACDLLSYPIEYAVVTGSKGKGSTTVITAKLLQHLGHTVGMITSPHLVNYRERIRVNGRAIPEADLLRILDWLAPDIDRIEATLTGNQYFSPQGIFLAIGLKWFQEQGVNAAVLEVGRGGRYDDIAIVPNRLSLFTPIILEHTKQLGSTLERIAWHKAGIIKPRSYAYSVPQATEVLQVLEAEADAQGAEFAWIAPMDMAEYVGPADNGIRLNLGRYGEMTLSLMGRYQVANATLAVQGAGNMHGRLTGIPHGSPEYVQRISEGLADVKWPGRVQNLQESPAIYIDGATNTIAARSFLDSVRDHLTKPLITILATPVDRDFDGVYGVFGQVSDALIITENNISVNVQFPTPALALATAREYNEDVTYAPTLAVALEMANARAGHEGTILMAVSQPVVGEAMQMWGFEFEQI